MNAAEADGKSTAIVSEQEPGSAGVTVVDYLSRLLAGFFYKGVRSTGSKVDRALPLAAQAEHGHVKLVRGLWNEELLSEFELFPYGRHDDAVDSASLAFSRCCAKKDFWLRFHGTSVNANEEGETPAPRPGEIAVENGAGGFTYIVPSSPSDAERLELRNSRGWKRLS
jgi:predicted phage terminase large subunit-like protein